MGICTVCLFTLAFTFLTSCTQGTDTSHDGLPVIKTHPSENYYIVKRKPVTVTCEAYDAMQITFNCSGQVIEAAKQENFQTFDPESGRIIAKSSIEVTQDDVRRQRGHEYWCECYAWAAGDDATPKSKDRYTLSRRGVISIAHIKRKFIEGPSSQTAEVGSKVLMKCSPPEAHPKPEVFWRKDRKRLSPETDTNIVINDDGSLVIHVVRESDAGRYTCIARNPANRRESGHGTLTVKAKSKVNPEAKAATNEGMEQSASDSPAATAARFLEEPHSTYYVTNAMPATITCKVKGAEVLDFRCNGQRVPEDKIEKTRSPTRVASERIITVRHDVVAQEVEEQTDLSCECHSWYLQDGKWASIKSMTAVVKLAAIGDTFVKNPTDQVVRPGSTVRFTCESPEGQPTPKIKWMRNGAEIEESQFQNIKIRNNILVVSSATRRDMADFSCAASNIAGSRTSAAARLTVSDRAVAPKPKTTTEAMTSRRTTPPPPGTPVYLTNLDDFYYIVGNKPATVTCKVRGADILRIRCNERRLEESQQQITQERDASTGERTIEASTTISRAQLEQFRGTGEFQCECVAWYTEQRTWKFFKSNKANVAFAHLKRRFQKEPTDVMTNVGGLATFECLAPEGNPKPKIFWAKDRSRLDVSSDNRMRVLLDGGQLEISNVMTSDAGSYTCEAENPAGVKLSRPAVLTVEGDDDVDRVDMESSTSHASAEPTTEPEPETTAEPPSTTDSEVPKLVPGVPIFIKEPEKVYYIVRDVPATITCRTLGADHLMFNCNGKRITDGENDVYEATDPETRLKILERTVQVQRSDVEHSDSYECDCSAWYTLPNVQDWQKMPRTTKIEIAYIKKRFMQEPVSQSVEMHVTTEIPCRPPKANPEPKIFWVKDTRRINEADDPNFTVTSTGSLVIRDMRQEDAGIYVCVAENIAASRMSSPSEITVYADGEGPEPTPEVKEEEVKTVQPAIKEARDGPPIFVRELDSMSYVVKGKATVLSCQAKKTGKITFYCNDAHVDPSRVTLTESFNENTQMTSQVATYAVTREDIAKFSGGSEYSCQCFAWYRMSGDTTDQFVSSRAGAVVLAYIKGPSVKEATMETGEAGQLVSLKCSQAKGTPWPKVSWQKNGERIDVMEDSNLVIPNDGSLVILKARPSDSGQYACIAENVAGRKQSALVDLKIKGPEMTTTAEPEPVPEISVPVGSVGENVTDSKYNDTEITPLPESSPTVTFNEANITEALDNSTEYVIVKGEPEPEMKNTTVVQTTTMPSYENVTADVSGNITKMDVATNISGLIDAEIEEATGIPEVVDNATMEHSKGGDSEPEPTSEPEATPEVGVDSTTEAEGTTPNVNQCMTMFRECNAILNEKSVDTSSDPSAMCRVRVNYTKCTDNFMDVCSGFIRPELMETMTTTREGFDKYCTSSSPGPDKDAEMAFPGCRKLQMCYSTFKSEINAKAILYSCVALQNYLHCADDAMTICNIEKPGHTKTTLSDIAGWFSDYCTRVPLMDKGLKMCDKRDACKLPLGSDTTPKQTIDVNYWCPFLHSTVSCTRVIASECQLQDAKRLDSDIHYLNTQAHKHCPAVNNKHPEGAVVGQTKEESDNSAASAVVVSTCAATLLPIMAALVIACR